MRWDLLLDPTIQRYTYRYRTKSTPIVWLVGWTAGSKATPETDERTIGAQVLGGLTGGQRYIFQVRAQNPAGAGQIAKVEQTPQLANRAPVIAGDPAPSVDENNTAVPGQYTATDADGDDTLAWQALAGDDALSFELVDGSAANKRTLQFKAAPNYEQPADANGDRVYVVAVIATDEGTPPLADTLTVAVQVTDADDPGRLVLSSLTPQVGEDLTATLTDEDVPLENPNWHWSYFHAPEVSGLKGPDEAERSQTLSVSTVHLGSRLLARVSYADRHGDQSAHSHTVDNLQSNTRYSFEVRAENEEGDGAEASMAATNTIPGDCWSLPPVVSWTKTKRGISCFICVCC